jgi:hypothetical protein
MGSTHLQDVLVMDILLETDVSGMDILLLENVLGVDIPL